MYSNYNSRTEESEKMKQEFKKVLSQYGKQIADTPERTIAIISDEYPDLKPEIKILKDALLFRAVHDSIIGGHFKKKSRRRHSNILPTQRDGCRLKRKMP